MLAPAVEWRPDLTLGRRVRLLEVPWDYVDREARDRGAYIILLRLAAPRRVPIGSRGAADFREGWYAYVGSAMEHLSARLAHHARPTKRPHWHLDYLRPYAAEVVALPIRSSVRIECDLARALAAVFEPGPRGFGSSDCRCAGHLFYSPTHPLRRPDFHEVLQRFRMRPPDLH